MTAYIGVDPGPSTGIVVLISLPSGQWETHAFQCTAVSAQFLLLRLIEMFRPKFLAAEKFIPSNRAGTKGKQADATRMVFHQAVMLAEAEGVPVIEQRATDIMGWATEKKLEKIGFPLGPKFRDARAAGKHALYAAVRYGNEKDPLR